MTPEVLDYLREQFALLNVRLDKIDARLDAMEPIKSAVATGGSAGVLQLRFGKTDAP